MRINKITLYNFGSYEGETVFNTCISRDGRNIILIGGKNGAGKTTLFTALRLCLYGYMSMGYKNANSFYNRAITKLINNTAKMSRPASAYVSIVFEFNGKQNVDSYEITRAWQLTESLTEDFKVQKNGIELDQSEIEDFEKYLLSLIPPELLNMYFFDGEKIADFFMEDGGNARIKEAFLTLCGYDTFEIMRRNFKRIGIKCVTETPTLTSYLEAKETLLQVQNTHNDLLKQKKQCVDELDMCEAEMLALEKDYYRKGGITQEEWDQKIYTLKEEEKKRETYNALLKKWANEVIPFLIVREQIQDVLKRISQENNLSKYKNFCDVLNDPKISCMVEDKIEKLQAIAQDIFDAQTSPVLGLSFEQSTLVAAQAKGILDFDASKIEKCKHALKRSLALTVKIRQELDESSVSSVQEYMKKRASLFEKKSILLVQQMELEQKIIEHATSMQQLESRLIKSQAQLEEELKKASIGNISARAIVMIDHLQQRLYKRQIEKVENVFRSEIKSLMRKTRFIDDIHIDDNFNIHIYREEVLDIDKLLEALLSNSQTQLEIAFGSKAVEQLMQNSENKNWESVIAYYRNCESPTITLPLEIDKTSLSNGEKQIFIMALYYALVQLCQHEIPFIIDTPFARIDTEHRRNISKYFFSKLEGQVFILSTNEEIDSDHVQLMEEKIAAKYMLENTDNKKTVVVGNCYFSE